MKAHWCHKPERIYGKDEVQDFILYLLDNYYVTVAKQSFKQISAISMCPDPESYGKSVFILL